MIPRATSRPQTKWQLKAALLGLALVSLLGFASLTKKESGRRHLGQQNEDETLKTQAEALFKALQSLNREESLGMTLEKIQVAAVKNTVAPPIRSRLPTVSTVLVANPTAGMPQRKVRAGSSTPVTDKSTPLKAGEPKPAQILTAREVKTKYSYVDIKKRLQQVLRRVSEKVINKYALNLANSSLNSQEAFFQVMESNVFSSRQRQNAVNKVRYCTHRLMPEMNTPEKFVN